MMNNPILFTDDQFNPQNAGACHLLIHLETSSYSYAIVDKNNGRLNIVAKNYFPENASIHSDLSRLEILRAENEFVNLDFEKVKVSLQTQAFTFVPQELYSQADLPQYSKFIGAKPESTLLNDNIHSFGIMGISAVDAELKIALQNAFTDPLIVAQANPIIAGVHRLRMNGNPVQLFLNFNIDSFEAVVIKNDTLEFYNIFEIATADEFNYFLLNLITEFSIDLSHGVIVSGEIESQNERYQRLQKYFESILLAETLTNSDEAFKGFKSHVFFSLLSLDLCE
ncbi:MAG TPA: DUF3822 family protein [Daejeonella sp.]|nr:DUF3822 family protein [Daejeonella sp.]